jgi:hypothetical protein
VIQLSIEPCCLDTSSQESAHVKEDCCQKTASSDNSNNENESKSCSPFFSCCAGAGFIFVKPSVLLDEVVTAEAVCNFTYLNHYNYLWHKAIFQPPQLNS